MVAFGKKLKERSIQEWQEYYINYKLMKKKVKHYGRQIEIGGLDRRHVLKDFSRMLDHQIEKIALFMLEQQGLLSSRLQKLREWHDTLQDEPDLSQISKIREAYRSVGQDLLKTCLTESSLKTLNRHLHYTLLFMWDYLIDDLKPF